MDTIKLLPTGSLTGHSSKGNQLKWKEGEWWYKADQMGYEGMAEVLTSHLLKNSTLSYNTIYEPVTIEYKGAKLTGCRSRNFLGKKEEIVTLEHLFRQYTGMSLAKELSHISDVENRISFTVERVIDYTGLEDFGRYLTSVLEMDAFFLNEDRHTNNIAVIYQIEEEKYRLCPYFDMGLSLFSDIKEDFPLEKSLEECHKSIVAKPFSRDFDVQLDAAQKLYGSFLKFNMGKEDMIKMINNWEWPYPPEAVRRVQEVLCYQIRKYKYMQINMQV